MADFVPEDLLKDFLTESDELLLDPNSLIPGCSAPYAAQ
jgi:hypothetical protein